jgi:hypothetical protein
MREAVLTESGPGVEATAAAPRASRADRVLGRATAAMLVLFVLAAPHSIAATQGAFIAGLVFWVARMVAARRLLVTRTPVDWPLAAFVVWTLLSVFTSYAPANSVGKLKGVSLFVILYLFASNVPTRRFAWALTLLLTLSTLGNLGWTYYERYRGQGLEIVSMRPDSPLKQWNVQEGDTIVAVAGRHVTDLASLNAAFDEGPPRARIRLTYRRGEGQLEAEYRRKRVRRFGTGPERLGIEVGPGREFRARGFFSHPVTYAEVLQMLAAMAVGWVIAAAAGGGPARRAAWAAGMAALAAVIAGALIQTETRASLASLGLACVAMAVLRGVGRRGVAVVLAAVLLLVAAGGAMIMYGRNVGFIDPEEGSTMWRLTVWREGLGLLAEHPLLGIGPDAARDRWRDFNLGDNGRLPPGHWHSTPLQLAIDRGVPALAAWLALLGVFFVAGARLVRRLAAAEGSGGDWRTTAAALGAWGAVLGFVASSTVHYNWGDGEVVQLAWALMGIALAIRRLGPEAEGARAI